MWGLAALAEVEVASSSGSSAYVVSAVAFDVASSSVGFVDVGPSVTSSRAGPVFPAAPRS